MTPKRIAFLVIFLIFTVFLLQNTDVVTVQFFFWSKQASRALVLLFTFVLGFIVGALSGWALKR